MAVICTFDAWAGVLAACTRDVGYEVTFYEDDDEPVTFTLCTAAAKGVKWLLEGEGADGITLRSIEESTPCLT